jgi:SAM-dependent methyltransferase
MRILYGTVENFEGWERFPILVAAIIREHGLKRVAEIGAGANPAVSPDFVRQNRLHYLAVDEDESELKKAVGGNLLAFDICRKESLLPGAPYDLVLGRMTAEHFRDASSAYHNMFHSLAPGGILVQSFACLYSSPFLVNRFMPEAICDWMLSWASPKRDREQHAKFKAYYRRCRGPVRSQIAFLEKMGFQIIEYRAYFGHRYYQDRFAALDRLEALKARILLQLPVPHLVSYATIILRRPSN